MRENEKGFRLSDRKSTAADVGGRSTHDSVAALRKESFARDTRAGTLFAIA
jgi:hypothetical protein